MIVQYFFKGEKRGDANRAVHRAYAAAIDELASGKWPAVRIGPMDSRYSAILGLVFEAPDPGTGISFRDAFEGRMRRRGIAFRGRLWTPQRIR